MVAVIPIWQEGHGHPTSGLLSVGGTISHLLDDQVQPSYTLRQATTRMTLQNITLSERS